MDLTKSETEIRSPVLFIDDDETALHSLLRALKRRQEHLIYASASHREEALQKLHLEDPEVVVIDLELDPKTGPDSGLELISELLGVNESLRIIVLTGHGSEHYGIEALKRGAASFVTKPADPAHILTLIEDGARSAKLRRRNRELEEQLLTSLPAVGLSSRNEAMRKVLGELRFAASTTQPVLLLGETGTGKGVIAEAIHRLQRPAKPFVRAQPSYGSPDLIQSELFGHERGAFTGAAADRKGLVEEADRGTLFLDEIDALSSETQVMLLDVLQSRTFRRLGSNKERTSQFRLIAATNRSLRDLQERIRPDLFHRISHLTLLLPPLRERKEDIPLLVEQFLRQISDRERLGVSLFSPLALASLRAHDWPGNIRELQAVVEQAAFRARFSGRATVEQGDVTAGQLRGRSTCGSFREQVDAFERALVKTALRESGHNMSEASRRLGLERTQFKRMLKRLQEL